jgi:GT2 family glycosyltransferase
VEQNFKDWNCVIVDNGSTDHTFALTKELVQGDKRFTCYRKENEGPSAGRNFGFSRLSEPAEYIHFLDGDDVLHQNFLADMIAYLESHPVVGLLGCQFDIIDSHGNYVRPGRRSRYAPGFLNFPKELSDVQYITPFETFFSGTGQGAFAVFRTSIFKQTSGYENSFWSHEDSDIFCQMALKSDVHYLPSRLYKVRVREGSLTHSPRANYGLFRKKWDFYLSADQAENKRIEKGLKYYYMRHKPLRDFKVALKAFGEFIQTKNVGKFKWFLACFTAGANDFFLAKSFRKIKKLRSQQAV